uniref:Uncharacterized protein n=1 Tax=Pseudodiaptomus poplesia TaxID=213370 RepID=A0A0U2T880_9MAXI|nr:hypothetical protein [Pseudodiaptomus poplesia]
MNSSVGKLSRGVMKLSPLKRAFTTEQMPRNIEELVESHIGRSDPHRVRDSGSQQISVHQSSRVFGGTFMSDQSSSQEVQNQDQMDNRLHMYELTNIHIDMEANVPQPYEAININQPVEGLPTGLSDAQMKLEARSNMDCRLEIANHKNTY